MTDDHKVNNADYERLKKAVLTLSEHFDAIQIFASRYNGECEKGTTSWTFGVGNWFAREGQVREWLVKETEASKIETREARKEGDKD